MARIRTPSVRSSWSASLVVVPSAPRRDRGRTRRCAGQRAGSPTAYTCACRCTARCAGERCQRQQAARAVSRPRHKPTGTSGSARSATDSACDRGRAARGLETSAGGLNALAAREPAIYAIERHPNGRLRRTLRPTRASATATLVVAAIRELSDLEPSRLRRCARPECTLVFYDITRSATQRWHAERPCGLRERQRRHRGA